MTASDDDDYNNDDYDDDLWWRWLWRWRRPREWRLRYVHNWEFYHWPASVWHGLLGNMSEIINQAYYYVLDYMYMGTCMSLDAKRDI